jgi:sugar fermentation stimulation protein A
VRELAEIAGTSGWSASVLFVLQRNDGRRIKAARRIDPRFADALEEAVQAGVQVLGRRCEVGLNQVELGEPVPVDVG